MRISIILLFISMSSFAESWSQESGRNLFDIKTDLKNEGIYLNYCFIFNNGRHLNCMDNSESTLLIQNESGCYITKKAINTRTGELFSLKVCMISNILEWNVEEDQSYLPKQMTLNIVE